MQAAFEFLGVNFHTAGGESSVDSRSRADIETIKTPGTSTWASGARARTGATSLTGKSMRTSVRSTTGKPNHRVVYEHAKEALGILLLVQA